MADADAGDRAAARTRPRSHGDDFGVLDDANAARARALCERHRQIGGVGLAVARDPDRAGEVVGAQEGEQLAGACRRDLLALDAEAARERELLAQHHHPLARLRDVDAAALLPSGRKAGLGLELRVQLDAVPAHPRHRPVRPHLADEPGGVPGRAAGELALLEERGRPSRRARRGGTRSSSRRCRRRRSRFGHGVGRVMAVIVVASESSYRESSRGVIASREHGSIIDIRSVPTRRQR